MWLGIVWLQIVKAGREEKAVFYRFDPDGKKK